MEHISAVAAFAASVALCAVAGCAPPAETPITNPYLVSEKYGAAYTKAEAECRYEAQAATVNVRGILTPMAEEGRLFKACMAARAP